MKATYIEKLPMLLQKFSNYLGDRKWLAGDNVS